MKSMWIQNKKKTAFFFLPFQKIIILIDDRSVQETLFDTLTQKYIYVL